MPSMPVAVNNQESTTSHRSKTQLWQDSLLPALLAVVLGAVLIYAAGFASRVELHNAAHDARHSAGFPCH